MTPPIAAGVRGPVNTVKLLPGEQIAVDVITNVGRENHSRVRVRIIGDSSFTWVDLAYQWGAYIEAVVFDSINDNQDLSRHLHNKYHCPVLSTTTALKLPPHEPWHGIVFATVATDEDRDRVHELFAAWLPAELIIAAHGNRTRREAMQLVPEHSGFYYFKSSKVRHSDFGGATTSIWVIIHLSRTNNKPTSLTELMTGEHYFQPLQASLDDTLWGSQERFLFEPCFGENYLGTVRLRNSDLSLRVYDAEGLAPDLAAIQPRFLFFWVKADSCGNKTDNKVMWPVRVHELFSIWDFEGKLSLRGMSSEQALLLLHRRLQSPPGKISRLLAHYLLKRKAESFSQDVASPQPPPPAEMSADIPYSPMELAAEVRAEASCADDAEIDLSTWALPGESKKMAAARMKLRNFAVLWWKDFKCRQAASWLRKHGDSNVDEPVIDKAMSRIKACRYFKWVRGSQIFYWLLPKEWQADFRDGIKIWQLPNKTLKQGRITNIPADTREHEILTREKIFKMWFNWYLEKGSVRLVIPRFTVPKANDVRVVWDSKANGHNAVLWAASFILGDFRDLEEITIKWLSQPVGNYLRAGSPDEDYSQDASNFIKSWQADIDVGQQFHNYTAHESDRPNLGVRMYNTANDGSVETEWFARFNVLHFGGRASPYIAGIGQQRILEWARGPPHHPVSPFRFARVVLNLPTMFTWDPSLPRVLCLREDGELASAEVDYVDDIHPTSRGRDSANAIAAAKWLRSRMNSVGNQADDRKYRIPTCRPGAWKGEIMHTDQPFPRKATTAKKWSRLKSGLSWILETSHTADVVPTAELRRIAGLGINVTEVYQDSRCYLKGFFNAIEAFRANRDLNGWRMRVDVEEKSSNSEAIMDDSGLTTLQLEDSMEVEAAERLEEEDAGTTEAAIGYPALAPPSRQSFWTIVTLC